MEILLLFSYYFLISISIIGFGNLSKVFLKNQVLLVSWVSEVY